MGTTSTFLKSRVSKPTVGKWSSGFSAVKKYADEKKIPLIAAWSNGDACGHCVNFEKSIMQSAFTKYMGTSGCVFWFGCSSDKTADDKKNGTGYKWVQNGKLSMYPFVRVWWKAGNVDKAESGDYWDGSSAKGGATFAKKLQTLLKNFKPTANEPKPAPTPTTTEPTDDCDGGSCNADPGCEGGDCCEGDCSSDGCGDCSALKAEVEALRTELKDFEASFAAKLNAVESKLSK